MDAQAIIGLSLVTIGKFREGPTIAHPAGRVMVAQRTTEANANYISPSGQPLAVYPRFIPRNPRTPAQQENRRRFAAAARLVAAGLIGTPAPVILIMQRRNMSLWHAQMSYLLSPSNTLYPIP